MMWAISIIKSTVLEPKQAGQRKRWSENETKNNTNKNIRLNRNTRRAANSQNINAQYVYTFGQG